MVAGKLNFLKDAMNNSSEYLNDERRSYSLYVLQHRSVPSITDGLKAAARRVMWTARDGKKYKSATLAGATMPIHPHGEASGVINTIAAYYGNNISLLAGEGAFGTLLNPTAYGAARYTSVKVSQFSKDVLYADIELIPMQENYDGTLQEPVHFLPLVPIVLLNPSDGIAVGFASTILPRDLGDIIRSQIQYLEGKKVEECPIRFNPTKQVGVKEKENRWTFTGTFKIVNTTTVHIERIPYGLDHGKYVDYLMKLVETGKIIDFEDNSNEVYNITIKFKRGVLASLTEDKLISLIKMTNTITENMNVLDFDGQYILGTSYTQAIEDFTEWRLLWYKKRYQRLAKLLAIDIQKYNDILMAIKLDLGAVAKKSNSRKEVKDYCSTMGIVHVDYIADLPVYRFTKEEAKKVEKKLVDANELMIKYQQLIANPKERSIVYTNELKNILKNLKKGVYNTINQYGTI
jgi:DNA gyrase subunit A